MKTQRGRCKSLRDNDSEVHDTLRNRKKQHKNMNVDIKPVPEDEEGRVFVIINDSEVHDTLRNGKKQLQGHQRGGPNMRQVSYPPLVSGGGDDKNLLLLVQKLVLHADEVHDRNGVAAPGHV